MKTQRIIINNIPAIIWGEKKDKVYIYVHGKLSCKEFAKEFAKIAEEKEYQTISFDLPEHGERKDKSYRCDVFNGVNDLLNIYEYASSNWKELSLYGCSLGAYFILNAYKDKKFKKCLFQSPIVNMEYLIKQMFIWFNVTERELENQKEINTPVDLLRWDYYQYVITHPTTNWTIPTAILYGGKDNLQSEEVIKEFSRANNCNLSISKDSMHPFMEKEDAKIVTDWLKDNI